MRSGLLAGVTRDGGTPLDQRQPSPPRPDDVSALDPAVAQLIDRTFRDVSDNPRNASQWFKLGMVYEANRLYGVLDRRLDGHEWIAADRYTIADMAIFPWVRDPARQGVEIDEYPNAKRWRDAIWARPQVIRALEVLKDRGRKGPHTDKQWEIMYGKTQRTQGTAAE